MNGKEFLEEAGIGHILFLQPFYIL